MADEAYQKLARVLDTLPNGFPATESGVEIKLLKQPGRWPKGQAALWKDWKDSSKIWGRRDSFFL